MIAEVQVRAKATALQHAALIVVASTLAAGIAIRALGGRLGTPSPPFLFRFAPAVHPLALLSVAVLIAAVALTPRWIERTRHPAVGLFALALVLGLSLNLARSGVSGWSAVFDTGAHGSREAAEEYLPGLPALAHGIRHYLQHYAQLLPYLPVHVRGNPPGPLIALHVLHIHSAGALTALVVGLGALTAPLAYDLGRVLGDERRARAAGVLTAFSPALLLFGVTSVDYAFATLDLAAACLLVRRSGTARAAGAVAAAFASFFSWLLLAIPVWAAIVIFRREGARRALIAAAASAAAVLVVDLALALALGYDPIAALRATHSAYLHGISASRPYAYWVFGSPVAWALMLGLPIAWLAFDSLAEGDPAAVALAAVIVAAAVLGFTKAETERIWLPFVPLACVAAAAAPRSRARGPASSLLTVLGVQALAVELLFNTVW